VSTEEENKAIFRRYIEEVWNHGRLELADEIFDRYLAHQPDGPTLERGPEDVKRFVGEFRSAFPDFRIGIDDQIAEGEKVMVHATIRGTHQREFRGMAPTGKQIEEKGFSVFRFSEEGKVVESWDSYYSQLGLMHVGESGLPVLRKFCPKCGSAIVSEVVATPDLEWLNAGTLDDPSWFRPQMNLWCDSAQPWVSIDDTIRAYAGNPPQGD
jgi:predicted ester cyclase